MAEKRAEQLPETASVVLQGTALPQIFDYFDVNWSPISSSSKVCVLRPFRRNPIRLMHPDSSFTWDLGFNCLHLREPKVEPTREAPGSAG